jgi:AraC-like DNA-binding protein
MKPGFVYIVTYGSAKWRYSHPVIKIGVAVNINQRICELNTASPINLILVAAIQSKDPYTLEQYLHKTFGKNRLNGEWFELMPDMITFLRKHYLNGDRFDELFDFNCSSEQLEIQALRDQIIKLTQQTVLDKKRISNLESQLSDPGFAPSRKAKHVRLGKMIEVCRG